jgi:hypothetical protein
MNVENGYRFFYHAENNSQVSEFAVIFLSTPPEPPPDGQSVPETENN